MNEAQLIPVKLPNILSLQGCLSRARAWVTDLEEIQVKTYFLMHAKEGSMRINKCWGKMSR